MISGAMGRFMPHELYPLDRASDLPAASRVVLASSGGADSLGALVWLHALRSQGRIDSLHVVSVDHQIHDDSAAWSAQACAQADFFGIPSVVLPVTLAERTGQGHRSLEARARSARYAALASWMGACLPGGVLVTAHHAEDQAETLLLAALRGSGAAGLAAMPIWSEFAGGRHWRPFLQTDRAQLRQWATQTGLAFVSDPSNHDLHFDRNYLRAAIVPQLQARWPRAVARLSQTAAQSADDYALLKILAEQDAGTALDTDELSMTDLKDLPASRQANILRAWIQCRGALMPPGVRLKTFIGQLARASPERRPTLAWGRWQITRYRDCLYWREPTPPLPEGDVLWQDKTRPLSWTAQQLWRVVPAEADDPRGLDASWLNQPWLLRGRRPEDRLRSAVSGPSRTLKNWFQARGIPPWQREHAVVIEINQQLAGIAGDEADVAFRPPTGVSGWRVEGLLCTQATIHPNEGDL